MPDAGFRSRGLLCADLGANDTAFGLVHFASHADAVAFAKERPRSVGLELEDFASHGDALFATDDGRKPMVFGASAAEAGGWTDLSMIDLEKSEQKRASIDWPGRWFGYRGRRCGEEHAFLEDVKVDVSEDEKALLTKNPSSIVVSIDHDPRDSSDSSGTFNAVCQCAALPKEYGENVRTFPDCLQACTRAALDSQPLKNHEEIPSGIDVRSSETNATRIFDDLLHEAHIRERAVPFEYPLPLPLAAETALTQWSDFVKACRSSASLENLLERRPVNDTIPDTVPDTNTTLRLNVLLVLDRARSAANRMLSGVSKETADWFEEQGVDIHRDPPRERDEDDAADIDRLVEHLAEKVSVMEPSLDAWVRTAKPAAALRRPPQKATFFKALYVLEKLSLLLGVLAAYTPAVPRISGGQREMNQLTEYIKGAHFLIPDGGRLFRGFLDLKTFLPGKDLKGRPVEVLAGSGGDQQGGDDQQLALLLYNREGQSSHYTKRSEQVACPSCVPGACGFSQGQFSNFPIFPNFLIGVAKRPREGAAKRLLSDDTPTRTMVMDDAFCSRTTASVLVRRHVEQDDVVFTFLQQEGAPFVSLLDAITISSRDGWPHLTVQWDLIAEDLEHAADWLEYLSTGRVENVGPAGTTPHTEFVDPIELTIAGL